MNQDQDQEADVEQGFSIASGKSGVGTSVGELILRLFGPVADEVGQYLADGFQQWRWRRENFRKVAEKCETEKKARGINDNSMTPVDEGDAYRLADACSFEDDEMVQEMWAGLITSAMDPDKESVATRAFVEILKAIGPVEAGLLLVLHEFSRPPKQPTIPNLSKLNVEELHAVHEKVNRANEEWKNEQITLANRVYRRFSESRREIAIQNLFRLRCIGLRTGRNLDQKKMRSGLPFGMSGKDTAPTYESFTRAADYLESLIMVATGTGSYQQSPFSNLLPLLQDLPEARFELTHFGRSLVSLCMTKALRMEVIQERLK